MYVGIKSLYLNYGDFRSPLGGAMKPPEACFCYFECTFLLGWQNDCNWLQRNCGYISIYVRSTCQQGDMIIFASPSTTKCAPHCALPGPQMGSYIFHIYGSGARS